MAQLQDLFQTHAIVKILDFLTLYSEFEYTRTDIAKETGISRRTLYEVWPILEKFDLVKITKTSGMIKFYQLNTASPISQHLITLADKISFFAAEKIVGNVQPLLLQPYELTPESPPENKVTLQMTKVVLEGTPSHVRGLVQEMLDLTSGQTTIHVEESTMQEPTITKKEDARAQHQREIQTS